MFPYDPPDVFRGVKGNTGKKRVKEINSLKSALVEFRTAFLDIFFPGRPFFSVFIVIVKFHHAFSIWAVPIEQSSVKSQKLKH